MNGHRSAHACSQPALLFFFVVGAISSVAAQPGETSRSLATYYFHLFADVVESCAVPQQSELTQAVSALNLERRKQPNPDDSEEILRLKQEYEPRYRLLGDSLGVIKVDWREGRLRISDDIEPLKLSTDISRTVLLEIRNHSDRARSVNLPGQRATPIPAAATRALVVTISAKRLDDQSHRLQLLAGRVKSILDIPIKVERPARLRGVLLDPDRDDPFPGRVSVQCSDGILRHGMAFRNIETVSQKSILQTGRNYRLPFFYSDGRFELLAPAGETRLTLERGYEHAVASRTIHLKPGETREIKLSSGRLVNMRERRWISGDTHVHWSINGWNQNEDLDLLRVVQRAEDIQVINNLTLRHWNPVKGEFVAPTQFPMGPVPGHSDGEYHVQMGEEYRNAPFYGHLNFLNITNLIQPISTGDLMGPKALDWPLNFTKIREARAQGGIVISAHGTPAEIPADVALGVMDSIDQSTPDQYYSLLNCGFRLPITTGSDHPARLVGHSRCYVKIDGEFSYANWIAGIRQRRTFVTSGPLIFLNVNGHDIGGELSLKSGDPIRVHAKVISRHPIGRLQIVSNKKVLRETTIEGTVGELRFEMAADASRWIVARCSPDRPTRPLAGPNIAHTSAIYVEVDGRPIFVPVDAKRFATRLRAHARNVDRNALFATDDQRKQAVAVMERGAAAYDGLIRTNTRWLRK